jgi:D-3-phosphoglycerate dehydrogenase
MLLFDAPLDFDLEVWDEYMRLMPLADKPADVTVWVVDPKGLFIGEPSLEYYPNLKILATPSTGRNHIDLEECERRGIKTLSLLDDRGALDMISASAEYTWKLIIDAMRIPPARELSGRKLGIVGYGRIGKQLEKYAKSFRMDVAHVDKAQDEAALERLFRTCDVIAICCTYDHTTYHLITGKLLLSMKKGAALVNTSRGEVIDETALALALEERPDLRVAVDVLEGETTGTANPYRLTSRGALVSNHIAGETYDSRTKAAKIILGLLKKHGA